MKKFAILFLAFALVSSFGFSQKTYITKSGYISFFSKAPLEDIEAHSYSALGILKPTGDMAFKVLINSFEFENPTMQTHFRENYLDSPNFPDSKFTGSIDNFEALKIDSKGVYPVTVTGNLIIKGKTVPVKVPGYVVVGEGKIPFSEAQTIEIGKPGNVSVYAEFPVKLEEFGVKIEAAKLQNISETVKVTVKMEMAPKE